MKPAVRASAPAPAAPRDAPAGAGARPPRLPLRFIGTIGPPIITLVIVLAAWQVLVMGFQIPSYLAPTPLETIQGGWAARDDLGVALVATLVDSLIGLALSIVLGLLAAIVITRFKALERGLLPYATVLQTIPIISIAPLILIWLGTGDVAIVLIALIVAVFPIVSNATLGLVSTDHNLLNLSTMYNASGWQQLVKLRLPFALPYILAGVRISSGLAVIGVIVGEFFAGTGGPEGGLGYVITVSAKNLQMDELFAATVLASILGILVFVAVNVISYFWLRHWHESSARREN